MAVVIGVSGGFVTETPSGDPFAGGVLTQDGRQTIIAYTSPVNAGLITEMGWYTGTFTQVADFAVGLYAADGVVVPGEAGTLLFGNQDNPKGTGAGWKIVTGLNWEINSETDYWFAVWCDNTATTTRLDIETTGGDGRDSVFSELPDPCGGGSISSATGYGAIYAVWEEGEEPPDITNPKVKVSGTFSTKTIKTKISGTFTEKPLMVKVSGTFQ